MLKSRFKSSIINMTTAVCMALIFMPACIAADDENNSDFEIKPLYVFQNKAGRDPFVPRYQTGVLPSVLKVDISTFTLLGITQSGAEKAALFKSRSGLQLGYVFMEGKLTADNDVVVSDVAGSFKSDTEILLRQGDKEVLFTMPKLPDNSNEIKPDDLQKEKGQQQPGEY
jgi:hypothetical protein